MNSRQKIQSKLKPKRPKNLNDVPVTVELFKEFQNAFNSKFMSFDKKFTSLEKMMRSFGERFDSIDKRFDSIDKRFDSIDKRFDSVDKRFDSIDQKIDSVRDELKGEIHEVKLLNEEQNSRNKFVIDQYVSVYEQQRDLQTRVEKLEKEQF